MRLSEALKSHRKSADLLQKQMAGIIGVSTEYYNKIEKGKIVPSWRVIDRIVKRLGISVEFNGKDGTLSGKDGESHQSKRAHATGDKFKTRKLKVAARLLEALLIAASIS